MVVFGEDEPEWSEFWPVALLMFACTAIICGGLLFGDAIIAALR